LIILNVERTDFDKFFLYSKFDVFTYINESPLICTLRDVSLEGMDTIRLVVFVILVLIIVYFVGSIFDFDKLVFRLLNNAHTFD
jgi:hypothetical protein